VIGPIRHSTFLAIYCNTIILSGILIEWVVNLK
jgi:hypothetical protein